MTFLRAATLAISMLAWPMGGIAQGVDVAEWNAKRVDLFSKVCMGSAPTFEAFDSNAAAAGFIRSGDKLVFAKDVHVGLIEDIGLCRCFMVMGAPDPIALSEEMLEKLRADFPGAWFEDRERTQTTPKGFLLEGVHVGYTLTPTSLETQPGLVASARIKGKCPA
ncbi:MAG: hypothetical protein AAGF50_02030 [Pseudomonadota bacterium]